MLTSEDLGWQPSPELRNPKLANVPEIEEQPEIMKRSRKFAEELMRKDDGG